MDNWEYGVVKTDEFGHEIEARRNKKTIEFVLWKAGEQGHKEDFWHKMGAGWWDKFTPHPQQGDVG